MNKDAVTSSGVDGIHGLCDNNFKT